MAIIRKLFRYSFITLFIGFFVVGIVLQTQPVRDAAKHYLIETIEKETGLKVAITDVRLFPSFQFNASGVVVTDEEEVVVAIGHIHTGIYPLELWTNTLHFHTLQIENVKIPSGESETQGLPKTSLADLPFSVHIDSFSIEELAMGDGGTAYNVKGNLYISPDDNILLAAVKANPSGDPDDWTAAEISYEHGIGSLQMYTEEQIEVDAHYTLHSNNSLDVERFHARYASFTMDGKVSITPEGLFEDSRISFNTGELSPTMPVEGAMEGDGTIAGPLFSPELDMQIRSDQLTVSDTVLNDLRIKIHSKRSKGELGGELAASFTSEEIPYSFSGKIFWDEAMGPLPTRFQAKTNLSEIAQILNIETTDIEGKVDLVVTLEDQDIKAKATLSGGRLESYELGSRITDMRGVLTGTLREIRIDDFQARDEKGGRYSARGRLSLKGEENYPYEVALDIDQGRVLNLDDMSATLSGVLMIKGDAKKALVKGELKTDAAKLNTSEDKPKAPESIDVIYINQDPSFEPPTPVKTRSQELPVELDIQINVPSNLKITGQGFSSTWKGGARVTGNAAAPQVNGELNVLDGRYRVRGRTLNFNQGTITFAGPLEKKTTLYIIGEMEIDKYTIEIIVKGPIDKPAISFRSNPPLTRKEILSWLLFNKDISDLSEFQGNKLNQSITTLSAGADDGPDILTRIGDTLGIDRIDISGSPDAGQVSFELGKYVSDSTYISISRKPVREAEARRVGTGTLDPDEVDQTNRIGIETSLGKYFKLQAEVDEDQSGQINLLWKRDY